MVELASIQDKKELQILWQITFLEDRSVTDDFFDKIFSSVIAPVIRVDGEIVSSLFLIPCKIGEYNGKCVYCAMTKFSHRGKGYMKELLAENYDCDFLILVPAEQSLFDYYAKCGFEKFGVSRTYTFSDEIPTAKGKLDYQYELEFDNKVVDYWKNSCITYGGEIHDFGLVFDDDSVIIRNAKCKFEDIPETYKKSGVIIQGDIEFGDTYSPAMIKTENENIKNLNCYIGITLE